MKGAPHQTRSWYTQRFLRAMRRADWSDRQVCLGGRRSASWGSFAGAQARGRIPAGRKPLLQHRARERATRWVPETRGGRGNASMQESNLGMISSLHLLSISHALVRLLSPSLVVVANPLSPARSCVPQVSGFRRLPKHLKGVPKRRFAPTLRADAWSRLDHCLALSQLFWPTILARLHSKIVRSYRRHNVSI